MNTNDGYRLYALRANGANIEKASLERFCRICPTYILIYKKGEKPENCVEVGGVDLKRLSKQDEAWLKDCLVLLLAEKLEKEAPKIKERLNKQIDELEKALSEEALKQRGGNDVG